MIELATLRIHGRNIFAAVLPDTPPGLRIVHYGSFYHERLVGCADPESVARQITAEMTPPGCSSEGRHQGPAPLPQPGRSARALTAGP